MRTLLEFVRQSILTRLWLVFGLLYSLSVLTVAWLVFGIQEVEILRNAGSESRHRSELALKEFKGQLELAKRDILLLSSSPSLENYIQNLNEQTRNELSALFEQYLKTREEYFQVRFIDAPSGMELIRLDKDTSGIAQKPDSSLQNKQNREYFEESIKLGKGAFYFSEINLNREHNEVSLPEIKTLRVASPIYNGLNELKGVLVINIDLDSWLDKIGSLTSERSEMIILKDNQEYILHPDDSLSFGLDRATGHLSSVDLQRDPDSSDSLKYMKAQFGAKAIRYTSQAFSYNSSPERQLEFIDFTQNSVLFASITEKRREIVGQSIMILFLGLFIIFLLAKRLIKPLLRMKQEVASGPSDQQLQLSDSKRDDELGSLARSFEELTKKLQEEAKTARLAMQKAEKLSEEKEDFLANFSHELRTPLNSILGMSEVLTENDPSPRQKPVLSTLKYAVMNLRALIGDVLDSSKIDQGEIELKKEMLILRELSQNLILSHKPEADRKSLELHFAISDDVPSVVEGDYLRLYQVLNNLLSNAVKFTAEGQVSLVLKNNKGKILFEVIDSGPGIPEHDRERIFEKYKQSEAGKNNTQGLGLGLNIAKNLVHLMGGELKLKAVQKGSHFYFELGLPAIEQEKIKDSNEPTQSTKTLLYVDDIAINRFTLIQLLKDEPYRVLEAESCKEAKEVLDKESVDLVIMDLRMPDVNGFECIKELSDKNLEFVALSANLGDVEKAKLGGLNVKYALEKPVNKDELLRTIGSILQFKSKFLVKLGTYFNSQSSKDLEKPFKLMIDELKLAREKLNNSKLSDEDIAEIRHKIKPTLGILDKEDLLQLKVSDLHRSLSLLVEELEEEYSGIFS